MALGVLAFLVSVYCKTQPCGGSPNVTMSNPDRIKTAMTISDYGPALSYTSWREQYLAQYLLRTYKNAERPAGMMAANATRATAEGGPVIIEVSVLIQSISSINDASMEFGAQIRFQQEWHDERLRFDKLGYPDIAQIHLQEDQHVWTPDTFFQNEKKGHYHKVDKPNRFVKIRKDGWVCYNTRLSMTFACTMYLQRYPHDTQHCQIDFASYAYTTNDIAYVWKGVVLESGSLRPKFSIEAITEKICTSKTNTGEYSCLRIDMELKRTFSFFLLQLYIPSIMLVGVSCVSYWIDWRSSPARVPLSIVTLLAMITQSHAINSTLPPVSYTKAIDIWVNTCIIFIFSSLIEYALVNFTGVREERQKAKAMDRNEKSGIFMENIFANPANVCAETTFAVGTVVNNSDENKALVELLPNPENDNEGTANLRAQYRRNYLGEPRHVTPLPNCDDLTFNTHRLRNRRRLRLCLNAFVFLRTKGRAERIDFISRILFPISFVLFNIIYWMIYWQ